MVVFQHTLLDPIGLHARTAGKLVKKAQEFPNNIIISFNDNQVDAKRLFAVMRLGAKNGDTVHVIVDGENAAETASLLQQYCISAGI